MAPVESVALNELKIIFCFSQKWEFRIEYMENRLQTQLKALLDWHKFKKTAIRS